MWALNKYKWITLYWLQKLHKTYISCTSTELSKVLTSCLRAIKKHVFKYCKNVYERSGKNLFFRLWILVKFQINFYARDFSTTSLSTYDFSTLYTTLSHNLLKINLSFSLKEPSKEKALLTLHVTKETRFSLQNSRKNIIHDLIKMYVMLDNLLYDLALSCMEK